MSGKTRLFLAFAVVALAIGSLRFVPQAGLSRGVTDFAGGVGVGLLIAVLVIWAGERTPS